MQINKVVVYRFFILFIKITVMSLCVLFLGVFFSCKVDGSGHELYLSALDSYSQEDFSRTIELCESILQKDKNLFQAV